MRPSPTQKDISTRHNGVAGKSKPIRHGAVSNKQKAPARSDLPENLKPSVYDFPNFGTYLRAWSEWRRENDSRFSLRGLALRANKSPSLVTMIARGERLTSREVGLELCNAMKITAAEKKYLLLLTDREHARSSGATAEAEKRLAELRPVRGDHVIPLDTFELMSHWYHLTIVEMTQLKSFRDDPIWISEQLGASVTPTMVNDSIGLLIRLGLLERLANGKLQKAHERVRTKANVPSSAIRMYHKQMIQRAHNAIDRQTVTERFVSTLTFPVPADKLESARQMIAEFRDHFVSTLQSNDGPWDEVYHLNLQFIRATACDLRDKNDLAEF